MLNKPLEGTQKFPLGPLGLVIHNVFWKNQTILANFIQKQLIKVINWCI
jgi:hypothetical protein